MLSLWVHVELNDNPKVQLFIDSMEALGLDQHVNFETHDKGHILDHIYTPEVSNIKIPECYSGMFIPDHPLITCALSIVKDEVATKTIPSKCFKKLNINDFHTKNNFDDLSDSDHLDYLVNKIDKQTTEVLKQLVPEKTIRITER